MAKAVGVHIHLGASPRYGSSTVRKARSSARAFARRRIGRIKRGGRSLTTTGF